jgi:hypothetical protein
MEQISFGKIKIAGIAQEMPFLIHRNEKVNNDRWMKIYVHLKDIPVDKRMSIKKKIEKKGFGANSLSIKEVVKLDFKVSEVKGNYKRKLFETSALSDDQVREARASFLNTGEVPDFIKQTAIKK